MGILWTCVLYSVVSTTVRVMNARVSGQVHIQYKYGHATSYVKTVYTHFVLCVSMMFLMTKYTFHLKIRYLIQLRSQSTSNDIIHVNKMSFPFICTCIGYVMCRFIQRVIYL